jgi:hypothetical protein
MEKSLIKDILAILWGMFIFFVFVPLLLKAADDNCPANTTRIIDDHDRTVICLRNQ